MNFLLHKYNIPMQLPAVIFGHFILLPFFVDNLIDLKLSQRSTKINILNQLIRMLHDFSSRLIMNTSMCGRHSCSGGRCSDTEGDRGLLHGCQPAPEHHRFVWFVWTHQAFLQQLMET